MRDSRNNRSYVTYVRSGMSGTEEEDGSKDRQTTRFVFKTRARTEIGGQIVHTELRPPRPTCPLRHYEYYGFVPGTSRYIR